ncbi:rhomboid family intramembrane serine protease [Kaistia algarum]|uniref:rhomboid family intramembrane serine protease n=1 Tax=Kaistia algarum TaxID=2083279 RepID=UPI000CE85E54|nr:rhomboid family intramembrane serine protease [Kaistia algarum]MCX5516137.1 rhomboid family intramembrane serine protease [Kaistia algarum]PPE78211.1 rhomboid family intramembrane serine protease [Kaistia algarum]
MDHRSDFTVREPVFNLPRVVVASLAVLVVIHAVRVLLLSADQDGYVLAAFAFVPVRLTAPDTFGFDWPGGVAGDVWTFATYALLHANWMHLVNNAFWMAAFGSPLAWRFGPLRFLGLSVLGAVAGAAAHLALAPYGTSPLIGASAAISAQMAAVARFAFAPGGRLGMTRPSVDADFRPALTIPEMIRNGRAMGFLGVWFVLNLVFGLLFSPPGTQLGQIAWEAHLGGFVVGLLFFPIFDPIRRRP